ncbi:hypothetical protein AAY473_038809, partial [Plecturocebus cupreus]
MGTCQNPLENKPREKGLNRAERGEPNSKKKKQRGVQRLECSGIISISSLHSQTPGLKQSACLSLLSNLDYRHTSPQPALYSYGNRVSLCHTGWNAVSSDCQIDQCLVYFGKRQDPPDFQSKLSYCQYLPNTYKNQWEDRCNEVKDLEM